MSHSTIETGATNATHTTTNGVSAQSVDTRLFSGVRFRLNKSLRKDVRKQVECGVWLGRGRVQVFGYAVSIVAGPPLGPFVSKVEADPVAVILRAIHVLNSHLLPSPQLHQLLVSNGATDVSPPLPSAEEDELDPTSESSRAGIVDPSLTHWITDTLDFAEYVQLRPHEASSNTTSLPVARVGANGKGTGTIKDPVDEQVKIVTPFWVTRSYDLQQLQQPRHYSADPLLIFSGLCVCCDGLPETDAQSIAAGVQSLGGQSRRELTREVTHLLLMSPEGAKYEAWLKHGAAVGMVALLPHWFEDCFKLRQLIPHDIYAFPDPPYINLRTIGTAKSYDERLFDLAKASASTNGRSDALSVEHMSATKRLELAFSRLADNEPYQRTALIELDRSHVGGSSSIALSEPGARTTIGAATTVASSSTNGGTTSHSAAATSNGSWPPLAGLATSSDANLFSGHRVYLASDLGLRPGLEEAIQKRIIEAGGRCWSFGLDGGKSGTGKTSLSTLTEDRKEVVSAGEPSHAATAISKRDRTDEWDRRREAERELQSSTIVITRTRQGWEWWLAYEAGLSTSSSVDLSPKKAGQRRHKMIGNLAWVYHVLAVGKLDPPSSRILHFPLPSLEGVSELKGQLCTISNYSGAARDYVRAMIEALGGTFDGAMCKQTKFVITASEFGNKVKHARQWGIPLVTHTWLEACLAKWAFINPALSTTYLVEGTSPAIAFPQMVGEARLSKANIEDWVQRDAVKVLREEALSFGVRRREEEGEEKHEEEGMEVDRDERGRSGAQGKEGNELMDDGQAKSPSPQKPKKKISIKPIPTKASKGTKGKQAVVGAEDSSEEKPTAKVAPKKKTTKAAIQAPAMKRKRSSSGLTSLSPEPEPEAVAEEEEQAPVPAAKPTITDKKAAKSNSADPTTPAAKSQAARGRSEKSSTGKGKKKADSDQEDNNDDDDDDGSSSSDSGPEPSFTKTFGQIDPANMVVGGSRRAAAGRAAQLLAQQMPDAIRFAKELKSSEKKKKVVSAPGPAGTNAKRGLTGPSGTVKREDGESEDEDEDEVMKGRDEDEEDEEDDAPVVTKPKAKTVKKRKTDGVSEPKDEEEEEHVPNGGPAKKKAKAATVTATAPKGGRLAATMATDATTSGQISSFDAPPRGKPASKNGGRKLMLMSTGLGLDAKSPEIKSLKPLGITWTDNPSLVTHLVVRAMQRTEKFLCCLGVAPKIVTKEWIDASLKAGELVDEEPYLLKDTVREREYKDTLVEILKRARTKQLFEDYTVYITPGTQPEPKTMQRICQSGGATVSLARLTPPIIKKIVENRERTFVVSCPGDRREWEGLARKRFPVFSVEAVFNSVMHQTLVGFDTASNNRIDGLQLER